MNAATELLAVPGPVGRIGVALDRPAATPAGLVPYLEHRGARIWESLAIAEYCAEAVPGLWPAERVLRAHARSVGIRLNT